MQIHDLLQEIQRLKGTLRDTDYNLHNLSDPDLVRISEELDLLILQYQKLKNKIKEDKK
ncbi:aspartyl-phosphate phosphatase Spo0E family protein [Bacillus sp. E(2018)]|uniref:aspartyl-phosphate phosphatase Spo0E family protein n=1 Tax=Bacillus sp. E(2018) TaxID=2502239 RepID=UPI001485B084|nr:aspartyl-phosphate phosphatase Spo0E family protein [Bacillus sp. E(2018)]